MVLNMVEIRAILVVPKEESSTLCRQRDRFGLG